MSSTSESTMNPKHLWALWAAEEETALLDFFLHKFALSDGGNWTATHFQQAAEHVHPPHQKGGRTLILVCSTSGWQ